MSFFKGVDEGRTKFWMRRSSERKLVWIRRTRRMSGGKKTLDEKALEREACRDS
jgi:hypothetical protein